MICVTLNHGAKRTADRWLLYYNCSTQGRVFGCLGEGPGATFEAFIYLQRLGLLSKFF